MCAVSVCEEGLKWVLVPRLLLALSDGAGCEHLPEFTILRWSYVSVKVSAGGIGVSVTHCFIAHDF